MTNAIWMIGLTIALGTFVKSTTGVAGIAFLVIFLPSIFGALLPILTPRC